MAITVSSRTNTSSGSTSSTELVGDATGATDIGAALQAAFDARPTVSLRPGGTYLLNTPVFLDGTNHRTRYTLEMNGATLVLGSGLPTASTFSAGTTRWAIFNGNLRAALSGGVVNCSAANMSTAPAFPSQPRLEVRNGIVDGQAADVGFVYGNTSPTLLRRLVMYRMKYGISWSQYTDHNAVEHCHVVSPVTGGWLVKQEANGDGLIVAHCKGVGAGIVNAVNLYGAHITAGVAGGYYFQSCRGVIIDAGHQELDEASAFPYVVTVDRSEVALRSHFSNVGKGSGNYVFVINDDVSDARSGSNLTLENCTASYYVRVGDTDPGRDPLIYVQAATDNTRVRVRDSRTIVWGQSDNAPPRSREGLSIGAADSGITAAITAGQHQIATGSFDLLRRDGAWTITPPAGVVAPPRTLLAPTLAAAAVTGIGGVLTNGQAYQYVAAVKSADGAYSPLSSAVTGTPTANSIDLTVTNPSTPCVVALWRRTGTGVTATPDRYIEIPHDGYIGHWFDTGTRINGRAWQTTSLPVPNTVAGTTATWSRLKRFDLAVGESTMPRLDASSGSSTLTSGSVRFTYLTPEKTETITRVRVITGGTAAASLTLARFGIYTVDGLGNLTLVGSTVSDTSLFAATNTAYTRTLSAAFTKTRGRPLAVAVLVVGATPPAILADALAAGASNFTLTFPPIVSGIGSQSDLPSTVAVGSLSAQTAPLYVELLP